MAMTNEQLTKWIDEIFGTIDEIKQNSGDITGLTRSVKQLRDDLTATQEDVSDLEDQTAGTVSLPKAVLQHFTDGSATQALDLVADIIPVQAGTGDPSPTNVRAITGYSSVTATAAGKNLFNKNATDSSNGYVAGNYLTSEGTLVENVITNVSEYIPTGSAEYMAFSGNYESVNPSICFYDATKQFISGHKWNGEGSQILAVPENAVFTRFSYRSTEVNNYQVEYGNQVTTFEAFIGHTATLSLGRTIYGGSADFTTGAEQETKVAADMGSLTWVYSESQDCFVTNSLTDYNGADYGFILSSYVNGGPKNDMSDAVNNHAYNWGKTVKVKDTRYTDAAEFTTAVTGQTLVYNLATPNTYTTTPAQLQLLQGENNVSATSGPITLTYAPDNVLAEVYAYIQKRFDTLAASLTANRTTTRKTTKTLTKKED